MCRHQMCGPEPCRQRKPCAVHRGARRDRSLATATVAFVSVCPALQRGRPGGATSRTNESIRPAPFEQEGRAARLVGKRRLKLGERTRPRHRVFPWSSPPRDSQQGPDTTFRQTWDNAISHQDGCSRRIQPLKRGETYRTDRALPKRDISCAAGHTELL